MVTEFISSSNHVNHIRKINLDFRLISLVTTKEQDSKIYFSQMSAIGLPDLVFPNEAQKLDRQNTKKRKLKRGKSMIRKVDTLETVNEDGEPIEEKPEPTPPRTQFLPNVVLMIKIMRALCYSDQIGETIYANFL